MTRHQGNRHDRVYEQSIKHDSKLVPITQLTNITVVGGGLFGNNLSELQRILKDLPIRLDPAGQYTIELRNGVLKIREGAKGVVEFDLAPSKYACLSMRRSGSITVVELEKEASSLRVEIDHTVYQAAIPQDHGSHRRCTSPWRSSSTRSSGYNDDPSESQAGGSGER